jgi:hypothetical protein
MKVLHWFNRYLATDENEKVPNEKAQMREWLRVRVGAGGMSLRETVRAHPSWGRKKAGRDSASFESRWRAFQRQHDATCNRVAALINARGVVPWFDIDDEGRAIGEDGNVITLP